MASLKENYPKYFILKEQVCDNRNDIGNLDKLFNTAKGLITQIEFLGPDRLKEFGLSGGLFFGRSKELSPEQKHAALLNACAKLDKFLFAAEAIKRELLQSSTGNKNLLVALYDDIKAQTTCGGWFSFNDKKCNNLTVTLIKEHEAIVSHWIKLSHSLNQGAIKLGRKEYLSILCSLSQMADKTVFCANDSVSKYFWARVANENRMGQNINGIIGFSINNGTSTFTYDSTKNWMQIMLAQPIPQVQPTETSVLSSPEVMERSALIPPSQGEVLAQLEEEEE
jgi:hypothetical protein